MFGFGLGLFVDLALSRRSASARWSSRRSATARVASASCAIRAHGLAPVAVGAAATAIAAIGFALLQFLLGVEAPVCLLLVRQILMTIVLNTLLALRSTR